MQAFDKAASSLDHKTPFKIDQNRVPAYEVLELGVCEALDEKRPQTLFEGKEIFSLSETLALYRLLEFPQRGLAHAQRQICEHDADEPALANDSIAWQIKRDVLIRGLKYFQFICQNVYLQALERKFLRQQLWAMNENCAHVVTYEVIRLVFKRLSQGYSNQDVADMIGLSKGTVYNIKRGTYRLSNLPPESRHGGRGRRF